MNGMGEGLYPNKAIPMMSQAVDQLVDEAKREVQWKREQEQWQKVEDIRTTERGEDIQRKAGEKKSGLMLDLINKQMGLTKDVGQKGELMKEALGVIGGDMDVPEEMFQVKERTFKTPENFKKFFGDMIPDTMTESQFTDLAEVIKTQGGLENLTKTIQLQEARTKTETERTKLVKAQTAWTSKRPYPGQTKTETHVKAEIIQKGIDKGFDNLSYDEKEIIGIDTTKGIQSTLKILQEELMDPLTGGLREDADPVLIERYEFLRDELSRRQVERMRGSEEEPDETDPLGLFMLIDELGV